MASLISYGMYVRACPRQQVGYLKLFTLLNLIYLLVLVYWPVSVINWGYNQDGVD